MLLYKTTASIKALSAYLTLLKDCEEKNIYTKYTCSFCKDFSVIFVGSPIYKFALHSSDDLPQCIGKNSWDIWKVAIKKVGRQ